MTIRVLRNAISESESWKRFIQYPGFDEIPRPDFSLGVVSKLLVDEALITFFEKTSSDDFWSGHGQVEDEAKREVEQLLELYQARGWLDDPLAFHPAPPDLEEVEIVQGRRGHYRFEHLKFESGYRPHPDDPARPRWQSYSENRIAHAWMLRHTVQEDRPWLICLHGMGMGNPYADFPAFRRGEVYEERGFNVLWYVKPFHGPRAHKGQRSHEAFVRGIGNLIQTQAQIMWDLRRIIRWIQHQHDASIGVYGLSLGGYASALLSTLSDDLDLVVAGIPGTDFVDLISRNVPPPREDDTLFELKRRRMADFWRDARTAMQVVSPYALPCRVPHERRFIFGGVVDRLTPPVGVRDLWLHWQRPRIAWYPGSHVSFLIEPAVRGLLDEAFEMLEKTR